MIKNKIYILLLNIIAISVFNCYAQEHSVEIKGLVVTTENETLAGVNIYSEKYNIGTTTDKKGAFTITVTDDDELEFSFVGYIKQVLNVSELENKDKHSIVVRLVPIPFELSGVRVVSEKYIRLCKENNFAIYDFTINNGAMYLLGKKQNNMQFVALTPAPYFDTINKLTDKRKFNKLFKDCFGNIHLLTRDSVYQTYMDNQKMHILYASNFDKFFATLARISICNSTYLYLLSQSDYGQKIEYLQQNTKTKDIRPLCSVMDEKELNRIKREIHEWQRDILFNRNGNEKTEDNKYQKLNDINNNSKKSIEEELNSIHEMQIEAIKQSNSDYRNSQLARLSSMNVLKPKLNPLLENSDTLFFFRFAI